MKLQILIFLLAIAFSTSNATQHPGLFLTPNGVKEIRKSMGKYPAFDKSVDELKRIADQAIESEITVPIPKDGGGGYTHEKHKNNYYEMNACGTLYQLTGRKVYAQFVRDMLLKYAGMYPTLGLHPAVKSETPGKIFWQTLNESVWLVHTANAYDCVYNFISESDRKIIEKNLFYPIAEFISNGNPANNAVFNKMHNHGTWATTAVGMIGYVMGDKNLVDMALYGSKKDGKTGFIRQLDVLFSPDGYFTEGPYYQRYAIWPFMTFAQVIQNQQPELKIFNYRDGILFKAVNTLVQCAYNGEIVYLNDALTKTYKTQEIVYAVDIAFKNNPTDLSLLGIARQQETFFVSDAGLATAKALKKNKIKAYDFKSILVRDGENGDKGGIAFLRNNSSLLTFKATSHGLSHGHYDKLSLSFFDNGNQILTDYGAARFLNIEPKYGGHYTKENYTWAMQSIAHNTVTVNETSHFDSKIKVSSDFNSEIQYSDISNKNMQIVSGIESNAYPGVKMQRTSVMIEHEAFEYPIIVDIFKVMADKMQTLDFPFYYRGQLVSTTFETTNNVAELKPLGTVNGYQHLWLEATGKTEKPNACFTFVNANRFYSISTLCNPNTQFLLTRLGANDPNFNLRPEAAFMLRQTNADNHTFVSIIEPHGLYDLSREVTVNFQSNIANIEVLKENQDLTAVKFETKKGKSFLLISANKDFSTTLQRNVEINGKIISFTGNYLFKEITN
ncbi:MAG TPA: alginate lyase family protein [Paludibacter sp.]|nr:alginate lyase family protein [Paludibacter sp.]